MESEIPKSMIRDIIDFFINEVKESLLKKEVVHIKGFATFKTKFVEAKEGESFGKKWSTDAKYVPVIKFSQSFKSQFASE